MTTLIPIILTANTVANAAANNFYSPGSGYSISTSTESRDQITWRQAGTMSGLWIQIGTNASAADSTLTLRSSGSSLNQTVTVPASTSGTFQDITNTDTIAAGALLSYLWVLGGAQNVRASSIGVLFADSTSANSTNRFVSRGAFASSTANTAYYQSLSGGLAPGTSSTEASAQFKVKTTATLQNLCVNVSGNGRTSATTVFTRIGSGNGNCTVSIGSSVTGQIEDTTHSDSLSSGNLVNTVINTGTGANTITIRTIAIDFITTNNKTHYIGGQADAASQAQNATTYRGVTSARAGAGATESDNRSYFFTAATVTNLQAYVSANTIAASSTIQLRKAGGAGNNVITVGSNATGYFEDTTSSDSYTASQYVDYQVVTGSSGANTITINTIGVLAAFTAVSSANSSFFMFM